MKKRVWVTALALGLGGLATEAVGEETVWRTVSRPSAPMTARGTSAANPGAMLGKPVPISRAVSAEPRRLPEVIQYASPIPRPVYGGIEPIATVAPPGVIIATSAPALQPPPPLNEESQEPPVTGDLFASDRAESHPVRLTNNAPLPMPPTAAPPTAMPVPAPALPVPATAMPRPATGKIGNWIGTFPQLPPPEMPPTSSEVVYNEELPPTKWYLRGEYLLWWMKNDKSPPLVTSTRNPNPDINDDTIGTLNSPATIQLFGGDLERNPFSGARFIAGYYLDDCGEKAIEFSGFFLGQRSATFVDDSFSTPVLTRPFLQANAPQENLVERISFPGETCAKVVVKAPSNLWGLEPNILCRYCCDCDYRIDLLAGFRYLNLRESLTVEESILYDSNFIGTDERGVDLRGGSNFVKDRFAVRNQFYGGQVGVEGRWQKERLTFDARAKVALGVTQQQLDVEGFQVVYTRVDNTTTGYRGGLLALGQNPNLPGNNIGSRERDNFSVIPELSVSVGYYLTDRLRALVGYNVIYWSSVVRPGDQIDPVLNINQIPNFGFKLPDNPDRPAPLFKSTDYWVQGITAGFEYRY